MFVTYGPLNPETDNFVGRAAELRQMERWLAKVRNYGAVVGARQTGKTSLLYKLRHKLQAKYGFVFVDLMELHGVDVAQCYRRLSKEVMEQLEDVLDGEGLEPASTGSEFHDFLAEVSRRSHPPRLTLILDEVGALPRETAQNLANTVRSVFTQRHIQRPLGKFVFIFSGATDVLELTSGETSPFKNVTEMLYVPDLSPDEATELMITGLEEEGLAAEPAIGDRVHEWTHGHPYLSQRVGVLMLEMMEEGHSLTVDLVDKAVERLQAGDVNLQHLIGRLEDNPEAQAKVAEILQPGSQVHFSRNDPVLARLEIGGVIRNEEGQCVIRNRIYRDCLQQLYFQGVREEREGAVAIPDTLREEMGKGNCVLFIGAGLSIGAGLPSWKGLVQEFAERVGCSPDEDHLKIAQYYENEYGRYDLVAKIREMIKQPDVHPTENHDLIGQLPVKVIFTTNYDELLEDALRTLEIRHHRIVSDKGISYWSEDELQLVKMHGSVDDEESIVVTEDDYAKYFRQHPNIRRKLADLLATKTFLFIGYSLSDLDFNLIYDEIRFDLEGHKRYAYSVQLKARPLEVSNWKRKHVHVINLNQPEEVAAFLRGLSA